MRLYKNGDGWFNVHAGTSTMRLGDPMNDIDIAQPGPLMAGKRGLIMGVANDRSIAWGIARVLAGQGAELAFTYQGEAFGRRAIPLAESWRRTIAALRGSVKWLGTATICQFGRLGADLRVIGSPA